ncbi:MAG: amidohydrolase [Clostridia bacterium]|nr:amidohydrolase [Clostridia bacterium]
MQDLVNAVNKHRDLILEAERYIWKHPETGYREVKTSKYMEDAFEKLGYTLTKAKDIPGFYTVVDTGRPGPEILILGELDSLICPTHKECDPKTGYVHACGHHAQCAALLGIAAALKEPGILEKFCGKIRLCAVPAEELIEIGYRTELRKQGTIKYFGGKGEFLYRGYFDGVDMAFMVHTSSNFAVRAGSVGCIAKKISYKGVASHAGGSPWNGRNALYAATQGLSAANAIRETFKEADIIRFHPIITHGGEAVNAIPELVTVESYVRGENFDAIKKANKKINQALTGAALSLDSNVDILDIPGYAPLKNDLNLMDVFCESVKEILPGEECTKSFAIGSGSTDMGDLCSIMPVVHPYAGGAKGTSHGNDYHIEDPERACVDSAKVQLMMLKILLGDNAKRAKQIIADFKPPFASKEEYLAYVDEINAEGDRIIYNEDGTATVNL